MALSAAVQLHSFDCSRRPNDASNAPPSWFSFVFYLRQSQLRKYVDGIVDGCKLLAELVLSHKPLFAAAHRRFWGQTFLGLAVEEAAPLPTSNEKMQQ